MTIHTHRHLIVVGIALSFTLWACNRQTLKVSPLNGPRYKGQGLIYSLPRHVLQVQVQVCRTTHTPGPYAAYAKRLLGIDHAPQEAREVHSIAGLSISKSTEADPNALYCAYGKGGKEHRTIDYFGLCASGLVLPIDQPALSAPAQTHLPQQPSTTRPNFTDVSPSAFIAHERSAIHPRTARDSGFTRVPMHRSIIVERNMEEKAKEAANFIFTLRKKRLDFLVPDPETPFSGEALRAIFDEINRLEDAYLSLFVGTSTSQTELHTFSYTPLQASGESSILFRFSESRGVVGSTDFSGRPVLLSIAPDSIPQTYAAISEVVNGLKGKKRNRFVHYRMPHMATISVSDGQHELLSQREGLYQYGTTLLVPLSQLGSR